MTIDRDLSARMPTPPPPRPDRRETAITTAMQRFDGADPNPRVGERQPTPARSRFSRPQLGALVAAALVATIGLPVWLSGDFGGPPAPSAPSQDAPAPDRAIAPAPSLPDDAAPPPVIASRVDRPVEPVIRAPEGAARLQQEPPPAAFAAAPPPPPPPPVPVATAKTDDVGDIMVTGSRMRSARKGRSIVASPNSAEALVADGVLQATRGQIDAAIATFDRAIDIAPGSAPAYLNRGLAYARKGETARALADLDRAVRRAPSDPEVYRGRSLVLRQSGQQRRADADDRRAGELDEDGR